MNIQIFGTTKCFDTKKAQRYFKERGIKFQMIDLKEKGMSRGEFDNVARALGGWEKMVNPNAKDKQTLALLEALIDWQKEDKLFENQQLLRAIQKMEEDEIANLKFIRMDAEETMSCTSLRGFNPSSPPGTEFTA